MLIAIFHCQIKIISRGKGKSAVAAAAYRAGESITRYQPDPNRAFGVAAFQMEKRGIRTERGNINREIEVSNQKLRQLKARISKLQSWLFEEMQNTEPPTLADVIQNILNRQQGYYSSINGLKQAANIHNFLTTNHIKDMADLDEYFKSMILMREALGKKLKPIERRLDTLDKHIDQAGKYQQYRSFKTKYDKLYAEHKTIKNAGGFGAERNAQKALDTANQYYEAHRMEITLCQAAERYLKEHLNGRDIVDSARYISKILFTIGASCSLIMNRLFSSTLCTVGNHH